MQNGTYIIFAGIKITDKLRDQLDASQTSVKHLFTGNDSKSLQVMQMDQDDFIVKTVKNGASLEEINNICLNLKSILRIICPKFIIPDDSIRIYAHTPLPVRTLY